MKKIIIVGATSGIGRALAILYLNGGHAVAVTGRRQELLEEIRQMFPDRCIASCFDISTCRNEGYLDDLISRLQGLDLLIFCSGVEFPNRALNWKPDEEAINTNIKGFVQIMNHSYNYFKKEGRGHLGAISSIAAVRGGAASPIYYAAKAFQAHYLEGLSVKAYKEKLNINITDIQPGFVDTAMAKGEGLFWVTSPDKAAHQIAEAIAGNKRKVYITRRWRLIAYVLRFMPFFIYKRM